MNYASFKCSFKMLKVLIYLMHVCIILMWTLVSPTLSPRYTSTVKQYSETDTDC